MEYPLLPTPSPTPQVACNDFVEYITNKYFPTDGSWINMKNLTPKKREVLDLLRSKIADSNFYNQIRLFIKNGTLFETALMTVNWGCGDLFFDNFDIFKSNIHISDSDLRTRGYVEKTRKLSGLHKEYIMEDTDDTDSDVQTNILYLPIEKKYIELPEKAVDNFFSIEIYQGKILEPKSGILPSYSVFPMFRFKPGTESLGKMAVGKAIDLEKTIMEFRERIEYVNSPTLLLPDEYFNSHVDVIDGKAKQLFKTSEAFPIPKGTNIVPQTLALQNDIPVDQTYIQKLEHDIFYIFKAPLIAQSKIAGLNALEEAQREIGMHNEIAPFLGGLLTRVAKNLVVRSHNLLVKHDTEYKEMAGNEKIDISTDFYLLQIKKFTKISSAIKLLEVAAAVGQIEKTDLDGFRGDKLLKLVAEELELPEAIGPPEETDQVRSAMAEAQPQQQLEQAKAEEAEASAELKQAQAQQLNV